MNRDQSNISQSPHIKVHSSQSPPVSKSPSHRLEAKQLTLAYDSATIVRNLNIGIPTGKTTVLVGANGCGKSTLLYTLQEPQNRL